MFHIKKEKSKKTQQQQNAKKKKEAPVVEVAAGDMASAGYLAGGRGVPLEPQLPGHVRRREH